MNVIINMKGFTFKDKSQKGLAILTKHAKTPLGVEKSETDYGELYEFIFDNQLVEGVTFDIETAEDIITNDGTIRAEKGEFTIPLLYLGKYVAIEKSAPNGLVIDQTPIPFELKYAEQQVDVTSTTLTAYTEFQSLLIKLHKSQEAIEGWEENEPSHE